MPAARLSVGIAILALLPGAATLAQAAEPPSPNLPSGEQLDFARHVVPTFYKLGCSAGTCHGAFAGKGGLRLSLFASRPAADYLALTRDGGGRRINQVAPDESLLLAKPSGQLSHGGGLRLPPAGLEYSLIRDWIASGVKTAATDPPVVVTEVRIEPDLLVVRKGQSSAPLRVIARLSNGTSEDVTFFTRFESLDPSVAAVMSDGVVSAVHRGDTPVLAHYAGRIAFAIAEVPGDLPPEAKFPVVEYNDKIDTLIDAKLRRLNILPAEACTDAEFLRRARLDITSTLPTPEEVREFLADDSPDKRARLIDRLLKDPLHDALWATLLTDALGADNRFLNADPFHHWLRNKLERNVSWDQIAYGILCATTADDRSPEDIKADLERQAEERRRKKEAQKAKTKEEPADKPEEPPPLPWRTGYAQRKTLDEMFSALKFQQVERDEDGNVTKRYLDSKQVALQLSSSLLGLQMTCAQCHKHPYDRWTQADFYGFAAVFSYVHKGVDPQLSEQHQVKLNGIHVEPEPVERFDELLGEPAPPRTLDGEPIEVGPGVDPRVALWKWAVRKDNPYFARAIVNRVWAHYFGRGLFMPVDGQSAANPPSHPQVLDELVRDFTAHDYDLRHLHRRILNLAAYARSWKTNATNSHDERNFSHRLLRRLSAEQVVDALAEITGTPPALTKVYSGELREGARVIEHPMSRFRGDDWHVLTIFGKPLRVQSCTCERSSAVSISQSLYLYNDAQLMEKITAQDGRLLKLLKQFPDDARLTEELYLWTLGRPPTEKEQEQTKEFVNTAGSRQRAFEDVLWSLLNRQEFIVNH